MKDPCINLNNRTTESDSANGNTAEVTKTEAVKYDINRNEKAVKNSKNNSDKAAKEVESSENGKDETDIVVIVAEVNVTKSDDEEVRPSDSLEEKPTDKPAEEPQPEMPPLLPVFVPNYKYTDDQWSPLNKSGKKCYDIGLLKQIKEAPLSKDKPDVPLLEACNAVRTSPMQEPMIFTPILRAMNDSLFPTFAKGGGLGGFRNATPREAKKVPTRGKGSVKLSPSGGVKNSHKPVLHVSLTLREDVKLKESDSAWKPTRFTRDSLTEEEQKNQEVYKKFRGILNKLTPQKFDTLLERVKSLEINTQERLEGVIDLIFEKAIEEPNFSEAYAAMCNKLSTLKVPADNGAHPDQCVNFRALIITKCQNLFETNKTSERMVTLEKELNDCTDPVKKKELQLMLAEENRRLRLRFVGNVRFIGELYKLKMLTCKIMNYCMKYLIGKLEEEKLECLCKLLTTIGQQLENEETNQLDNIFKKMEEIVDKKPHKISSRVKFMIQDVIALRKRKWLVKSVVDHQPKMMDQILKEAEQQQRHIELMNAGPMGGGGGSRRDDVGRSKRGGDARRQHASMDNTWKTPTRTTTFPVDTSKLKAGTQRNLHNVKLAPHQSAWNHGSGTKAQVQHSTNSLISVSNNMYSVLENVQIDPTSIRANRDMTSSYRSKGASIDRSTFNSRSDCNVNNNNRSGSGGPRSPSSAPPPAPDAPASEPAVPQESRAPATPPPAPDAPASEPAVPQESLAPATPPPAPDAPANEPTVPQKSRAPATPPPTPDAPASEPAVPQEPFTDDKMRKFVRSTIDQCLINSDNDELVHDVEHLFPPRHHAAVVSEILNVILEKAPKEVALVAKSLLHLVSTGTIAADNFLAGIKETFELAPDLYIDIPMLYEYLGKLVAPQIEKKHITLIQTFNISESIIAANHGHLLLKGIISNINESMGPTFVKSKWQESGLKLNQWMKDDQVHKWIEDNKFEFLETDVNASDESNKMATSEEQITSAEEC